MFPFRELELFDIFMLGDKECEKVAIDKYLVYNKLYEAKSLEVADPNMMVRLLEEEEDDYDDEYLHDYFFSTLISMIEAIEQSGENVTLKDLKKLAMKSLEMHKDP
jgi:hypothetical protein